MPPAWHLAAEAYSARRRESRGGPPWEGLPSRERALQAVGVAHLLDHGLVRLPGDVRALEATVERLVERLEAADAVLARLAGHEDPVVAGCARNGLRRLRGA